MENTKEGAVLTAEVEAVTWKHSLEPDDGPRKVQRVVIYPKEMTQLEQVLSRGDPDIDSADGHPIACTQLLQASQSYEHPPIFLKEDSPQVTSSENADKVPVWMNIEAQVATGNRRMVLEDGPDAMNSDDDDALEDVKPDEEKGMYTPEMDPKQGPVKLTQAHVATQKAAAQMLKSLRAPPRSQSPVGGSSDEDEPAGSEWKWSQTKGCVRKNKFFRGNTSSSTKIEKPTPKSSRPSIPRSSTPVGDHPVATVNVPSDSLPVLMRGNAVKKGAGTKAATKPADQ
jgi:hypothetical protein